MTKPLDATSPTQTSEAKPFTLKVGGLYRAMWLGTPSWVRITKICIFQRGKAEIHYKIVPHNLPQWLWWLPFWPSSSATAEQFVYRMDRARFINETPPEQPPRSVPEIEVKYR